LLILTLFSGCICTQPLATNTSSTTVVLLKNRKAHNAIIISTKKGKQKLDKPREFLDVKKRGLTKPKIMSRRELKRRFKILLSLKIPQAKSYRLFFKKDKMELTNSSKKLIGKIVKSIINRAPSITDIIGNTDTIGSEEKNFKISMKQSTYVASILKKEILNALTGIKDISLESKGYGELDLLIPTANNIAEERNRNVEILIK